MYLFQNVEETFFISQIANIFWKVKNPNIPLPIGKL